MKHDRITELEIKLAYQEELIETLNAVVAKQQSQIGKLEETCRLLYSKIESVAATENFKNHPEPPPPHY
jgi:SlyX protein